MVNLFPPPVTRIRPLAEPRRALPVIAGALAVLLALSAVLVVGPTPAMAATTLAVRCDVNVRVRPKATARVLKTLPKGTRVTAVKQVVKGRWTAKCGGTRYTSKRWWKISHVNGVRVKKLYGVDRVYAATRLFRTIVVPVAREAACSGVALRSSASLSGNVKDRLAEGEDVLTVEAVSGGSWSASCDGSTSGSKWYRISHVNGDTVQSLYGVSYLYSATGLYRAPTPDPTPTPTPKPTPTPTPTPKPTATPSPTPTPSPVSSYVEGIDVSHWQGAIDWAKVAGAGKAFVYIKASEDTDFVDDRYATNRSRAKANGLYVGAYHFARPETTPGDAVAEADHFIDTAGPASGELIPVLDLEQTGGLDSSTLRAWVKAFLQRVYDRTGVRAAIYTSPSFWSNKMANTGWFAANGYQVLWVAHWTTATSPTLPASNWGGYGWTFWQYTSSGTVPGIEGRVDLDRYRSHDFSPVLIP